MLKLNYNLDKYGVGREPLTHIVDNIDTSGKEKTSPNYRKSHKRIQRIKTKPIMVGESLKKEEIPIKNENNKKTRTSFQDSYNEKIKKAKEKEEEKQLSLSEILKQNKKFINKTQKEILQEAGKQINKNLIIDEMAYEIGFEGSRWFDLMRVANRRDDPSYLADKVAQKYPEDSREKIRQILLDIDEDYRK